MSTDTKETKKGRDRTDNLPTKIVWRDALRSLEVGDYFRASHFDRTSILGQAKHLKDHEKKAFTTRKINREEFRITRTK